MRSDLVPNQFDPTLSSAEAYAACGPAAAVAFARANGRNPTLREALELAKTVGWTSAQGMAGPGSQQRLLTKMGVASKMESGVNWAKVRADVESGNPVIISTPQHYFVATAYDPSTDRFDFQASGTALKAGGRWLTPSQVSSLGRGIQASIYLDSPSTPNPSPTAGKSAGMSQALVEEAAEAEGGEGEAVEPVATGPITPARIAELVRQHGQYSAVPKPGTEEIADPSAAGRALGKNFPNPDPTWEITFADGTKLDVKGERDAEGNATGNWTPTGGDTGALRPPSTGPASEIWQTTPDGMTQIRVRNDPASGRKIPVLDADGNPITQPTALALRGGGGTGGRPRTASQEEASAASAALARARAGQIGQPTPLAPETAALREAQTQKAQIDTLKAARDLIPEQLRLLQEANETAQYVADQYAAGAISFEELEHTRAAITAYRDAALRGTTPAKEEELRQQETTKRAQEGRALLNERVQSGTRLASDLHSQWKDLFLSSAGYLEEPLEFNPLQYAQALTEELGGGQRMAEIAQMLLAQATPQGAQMPSPALAAPRLVPNLAQPQPALAGVGAPEGVMGALPAPDPAIVAEYEEIFGGEDEDEDYLE